MRLRRAYRFAQLALTLVPAYAGFAVDSEVVDVFFAASSSKATPCEGLYSAPFDVGSGTWKGQPRVLAPLGGQGFLARHPSLPVLYVSSKSAETGKAGVAAFRVEGSGGAVTVEAAGFQESAFSVAAHVAVHPSGQFLVLVHYGAGTVEILPLDAAGAPLPPTQVLKHTAVADAHPTRQDGPHPHYAEFSPSGDFMLVPDLGADLVYIYRVGGGAAPLTEHARVAVPPGAGPRHLKFSVDGSRVYVIGELSGEVSTFHWDGAKGTLTQRTQTPGMTDAEKALDRSFTSSEIALHPSGPFLYTANRGPDNISVFRLGDDGQPERIQLQPLRGAWPRHFALDPAGNWLLVAAQHSDSITVYSVDPTTGRLTHQPGQYLHIPQPMCILFW